MWGYTQDPDTGEWWITWCDDPYEPMPDEDTAQWAAEHRQKTLDDERRTFESEMTLGGYEYMDI